MEAAAPVLTCGHCGSSGSSRFCGECGRPLTAPASSVPGGFRELVQATTVEVIGFDRRLLTTLKDLVRHPGRIVRDHLDGRTAPYVHPLKLFLFLAGVYVLGMSWVQPIDFTHDALTEAGISDAGAHRLETVVERRGLTLEQLNDRFQDRMSALTPLTTALSLLPGVLILVLIERGHRLKDHLTYLIVASNSTWITSLFVLPLAIASKGAHALVLMILMNVYLGIAYFAAYGSAGRRGTGVRFTVFAIANLVVQMLLGLLLSGAIFLSVLYI